MACSGEAVCVTARNVADAQSVLNSIIGHDDKDGTSLSEAECQKLSANAPFESVKKVAVAKSLAQSADEATREKLHAVVDAFKAKGIEVEAIDDSVLLAAKTAWNVLMCAELCNNVSKYDGIKYGYRSKNYTNIDELYTNSRTEAFGLLLKTAVLYGSDVLSTKNYMSKYDKAMRVRRVISEAFAAIFAEFDAVLLPAVSKSAYTAEDSAFVENKYTAPAQIAGLPAVVAAGVQVMGPAFSDGKLLALAALLAKEGK